MTVCSTERLNAVTTLAENNLLKTESLQCEPVINTMHSDRGRNMPHSTVAYTPTKDLTVGGSITQHYVWDYACLNMTGLHSKEEKNRPTRHFH